jgi:D-alanyl-D-alanine carboxypeptidase
LEERIFKPLGMYSTRPTDLRPIVPNRASGYEWANGTFENRPILAPFIPFSAGCILSTVEDLAKWDAALYGEKLLKKSSLRQIWTPAKTNNGAMASFDYGFGWFVETYRGRRDIHHSGGTPGFSSSIHRFVDDKLTIIILTNHADRILDQMAINIAGTYAPVLRRPQGKTDPNPTLTLRLKEIVYSLLNGKYDPSLFTPAMQIHLGTATGKSLWKWFAYHGTLKSFTFSDREDNGNSITLHYRVVLGDHPYWFSIRLMKDGRIAQIYWW